MTVVTLVLLELALRGLGFFFLADGRPLRGSDASEYVILCVGDSWTHGLGSVSYGEALEAKLNARGGDVRYRVIRSGIPGSNSSQGLRRLARLLPQHRPDMIIALLGNNDHQNLAESEYWEFRDKRASRARLWKAQARIFVHSLRVYKLFRNVQLRVTGRPTLDRFFFADRAGEPKATSIDFETHRRQLVYNLTRIVELSRIHDAELIFMTYFYFHGYEVNEDILDVASVHGVPVVNNTVLFHERISVAQRGEYFVSAHPTTKGHAFIADNIIALLEETPGF